MLKKKNSNKSAFMSVLSGIIAFLIVMGLFKLFGLVLESFQQLVVLLLILIYFELIELNKNKANTKTGLSIGISNFIKIYEFIIK